MYLAGPICEGIECAPLVVIVIASMLVPVMVGLAAVWFAAGFILRLVQKKRGYAISPRKSTILKVAIVSIVGVFALGVYVVGESKWYKNFVLEKGIEQVEQLTILQPTVYPADSIIVLVRKYGLFADPSYEAVTIFKTGDGKIQLTETQSGQYGYDGFANSQKTCDIYQSIRYCYVDDPKYRPLQEYANFYVYLPDKEIRLEFTRIAAPVQVMKQMIDGGWESQQLKTLPNVTYTDSILDLPL